MADVATSRIFVKGLPPTFTEAEFRKHFAGTSNITDAKIFTNRRIGYVGYKSPEDAQKAVRYFNRTFIRMSRIGVELARPIQDAKSVRSSAPVPTARKERGTTDSAANDGGLKRKRDSLTKEDTDPKLAEFLEAYKPKSKRKAWEDEQFGVPAADPAVSVSQGVTAAADEPSDEEYGEVPAKMKRAKREVGGKHSLPDAERDLQEQEAKSEVATEEKPVQDSEEGQMTAVTDEDWARSRTSRLLGLLDDDEGNESTANGLHSRPAFSEAEDSDGEDIVKGTNQATIHKEAARTMPTPPSDEPEAKGVNDTDNDIAATIGSTRLFVRNLPFDVRPEELEADFAPFGSIEEVSSHPFSAIFVMMIGLIGTSYATACDVNRESILVDASHNLIQNTTNRMLVDTAMVSIG